MASTVFVIGHNVAGELGFKSIEEQTDLVESNINEKCKNIQQIISGKKFSVYIDNEETQNIWTIGDNLKGQCADHKPAADHKFKQLNYFQDEGIKIAKICTSPAAESIFWITDKNQVYANGANDFHQLGIGTKGHQYNPVLVESLSTQHVIDIQASTSYTIALCSNSSDQTIKILHFWCRENAITMPEDIINIINAYNLLTKVLAIGFASGGGTGLSSKIVSKWTEIDGLKDKNIVKIRVGDGHSVFLESNGTVWTCGYNYDGQCGLGHTESVWKVSCVQYFVDNDIKIKEIECGWAFNIMMDYDGRIWMFGDNMYGQLGIDGGSVAEPMEIEMFRDEEVEIMRCGLAHVYVRCKGGKHYLWGDNSANECLMFDGDKKAKCHDITEIVKEKTGRKMIKDVFLGYDNTKIIVYDG